LEKKGKGERRFKRPLLSLKVGEKKKEGGKERNRPVKGRSCKKACHLTESFGLHVFVSPGEGRKRKKEGGRGGHAWRLFLRSSSIFLKGKEGEERGGEGKVVSHFMIYSSSI